MLNHVNLERENEMLKFDLLMGAQNKYQYTTFELILLVPTLFYWFSLVMAVNFKPICSF